MLRAVQGARDMRRSHIQRLHGAGADVYQHIQIQHGQRLHVLGAFADPALRLGVEFWPEDFGEEGHGGFFEIFPLLEATGGIAARINAPVGLFSLSERVYLPYAREHGCVKNTRNPFAAASPTSKRFPRGLTRESTVNRALRLTGHLNEGLAGIKTHIGSDFGGTVSLDSQTLLRPTRLSAAPKRTSSRRMSKIG